MAHRILPGIIQPRGWSPLGSAFSPDPSIFLFSSHPSTAFFVSLPPSPLSLSVCLSVSTVALYPFMKPCYGDFNLRRCAILSYFDCRRAFQGKIWRPVDLRRVQMTPVIRHCIDLLKKLYVALRWDVRIMKIYKIRLHLRWYKRYEGYFVTLVEERKIYN